MSTNDDLRDFRNAEESRNLYISADDRVTKALDAIRRLRARRNVTLGLLSSLAPTGFDIKAAERVARELETIVTRLQREAGGK